MCVYISGIKACMRIDGSARCDRRSGTGAAASLNNKHMWSHPQSSMIFMIQSHVFITSKHSIQLLVDNVGKIWQVCDGLCVCTCEIVYVCHFFHLTFQFGWFVLY